MPISIKKKLYMTIAKVKKFFKKHARLNSAAINTIIYPNGNTQSKAYISFSIANYLASFIGKNYHLRHNTTDINFDQEFEKMIKSF